MKRKRFAFHPACLLFPKLGKQELQELADDIKQNGLQNSIVLFNGKILDGRNRLEACKLAKVQPRFEEWEGDGSPLEWVISQNMMRRHLSASQKAVIAFDLLPLLEKEAKERQRRSKGRGKKVAQSCATFSGNGKVSHIAARIAKTGSTYIEQVKTIHRKAPELLDKIRRGQLTVPESRELANLSPKQRRKGFTNFFGMSDRPNDIETPLGICRYLHDLISPCYRVRTILDPCAGRGNLTKPWKKRKVISFEITRGKDFFECPQTILCDLVLCNPPFGGDGINQVLRFFERILDVVSRRTPIAVVVPMTFRLDQRRRSTRWRWLRDECPPIASIISLPRDAFEGVDYFCEILLFNMPKLMPHYFLPDEYL